MKRGWLALGGGVGLSALWRRWRNPAPEETGPDPAEELRAKLAASRATASVEAPAVPVPDAAAEEPVAQPEADSPLDPEARRRSLHDRARASIEELASDD